MKPLSWPFRATVALCALALGSVSRLQQPLLLVQPPAGMAGMLWAVLVMERAQGLQDRGTCCPGSQFIPGVAEQLTQCL